ncbi:sulfate/molybdate ABC transporter ATP-binding protein [Magnetospirillum sp. 64-120]|uniref:sulfate/molybdate ABC transporter ATP-binding protein n=1 Tax=Magnetospirillum sp. 64-120 TaxID=1895778 RepID=UPI00092B3739|nr:sulfate/molybdate ABC transporter ATP-binding protein [Magnetospirillum sp. 64-120]OJX79367.1 MAG: sulfate ABC transporter ATP-binding protein [Magnetospirillum sp. 64-120]
MIDISNLSKRFGAFAALDDVSLRITPGKLVALLGPSGSGKTTLLRILAGLDHADGGAVQLNGLDAGTLKTRDRRVGFVFQHYALFRHMSVADNVAFGLKVKKGPDKPNKAQIAETVGQLLDLVQLTGLAGRYPQQLSGGQRQRVALARALAVEPRLLLLDEPFGALDAQVRKDLRRWLRRLHDDMGLTSVFVTHDQEEALELADEVVVMNKGRVEQVGSPADIYDNPATPFVFQFLGNANRLDAVVRGGRALVGPWTADAPDIADGPAVAFVRPHDLDVVPGGDHAIIRHQVVLGPTVRLDLVLDDDITAEAIIDRESHARLNLRTGDRIGLQARRIAVFAAP